MSTPAKKGTNIGIRLDDESNAVLERLVRDYPLVTKSAFGADALRRGLASLERDYPAKPRHNGEHRKAA